MPRGKTERYSTPTACCSTSCVPRHRSPLRLPLWRCCCVFERDTHADSSDIPSNFVQRKWCTTCSNNGGRLNLYGNRKEVHGKEEHRKENSKQESLREEDHREEDHREEDSSQEDSSEESYDQEISRKEINRKEVRFQAGGKEDKREEDCCEEHGEIFVQEVCREEIFRQGRRPQVQPARERGCSRRDARDEARSASPWPVRQEGDQPQAGDCDRFVEGTPRGRKGPAEPEHGSITNADQTCICYVRLPSGARSRSFRLASKD